MCSRLPLLVLRMNCVNRSRDDEEEDEGEPPLSVKYFALAVEVTEKRAPHGFVN